MVKCAACMGDERATGGLLEHISPFNTASYDADRRINQLAQAHYLAIEHALITDDK